MPGTLVRGRGEGDTRDVGETFCENSELPVFGTEIVAPLRNAVRLVYGKQRDLMPGHECKRAVLDQPFGCNIEEIELTGCKLALDGVLFTSVERRIQECGPDSNILQRIDLILHQCDQRGDNDARASADE